MCQEKNVNFFPMNNLMQYDSIKGMQIVVFSDMIVQVDSNYQKRLEPVYWIVEEKKK
jgi:hypothetical protein